MRGRTSTINGHRCEKWFEIYNILNSQKTAILAIQGSHLTDDLADTIRRAYNTKMSLLFLPLPDSRNAAGVAFVINEGILNPTNITYTEIVARRAILASVPWHANSQIKILNIYAPNDP
jgi:hypothetical protein